MSTKKIKTIIEPDKYYHIYNQGNNHQHVFFHEDDYLLFLDRYKHYMNQYVNTYAFCLIPNHYHFLVKIKLEKNKNSNASNEFRKFFLSYTNKINISRGRTGSLFLRYFKRIEITNMDYLKRLVCYIHNNPVKHGLVKDFRKYRFSSYSLLTGLSNTILERNEVMEWFGSLGEFIDYHNFLHSEEENRSMYIED